MAGRLAGKSAVVTGGTRGIGYAIAAAFLAEGANVFVSGATADSVAAALRRLEGSGPCAGAAHDLTTPDAPARPPYPPTPIRLFEKEEVVLG